MGFFVCFLSGLNLLGILQTFSCRVGVLVVLGQQLFTYLPSLVALEKQGEIEFNLLTELW